MFQTPRTKQFNVQKFFYQEFKSRDLFRSCHPQCCARGWAQLISHLYTQTNAMSARKKLRNKKKQHLQWIYCEPERLSSSKSCAKYEKWRDHRRQRRRWGRRWHFWLSPGPQHRFLGTTDTIKSRLKKATKQGQQCTLRFKMHFNQKGRPDSRLFCFFSQVFVLEHNNSSRRLIPDTLTLIPQWYLFSLRDFIYLGGGQSRTSLNSY